LTTLYAKQHTWLIYVAFALLAFALLALQTAHYDEFDYQLDEVITIHHALTDTPHEVVLWMATNIHPPLWRVTATSWVTGFGIDQHVTRFLSVLFSAVTLALVFRLGTDLFGWRVGLVAVFLIGTLSYYQYYSREFRPYTALVMFAAAVHLTSLRWLRRPNFARALLAVISGACVIYTHFFGLYVLAAQAIVMLLLVRWNRGLFTRAVGLYFAIGLSFLGWLPSFIYSFTVKRVGGVSYEVPTRLEPMLALYAQMQIRPVEIGGFLLLTGLLVPVSAVYRGTRPVGVFRFGQAWRKWYVALLPLLMIVLVFAANLVIRNATGRNLTMLYPSAVVLAAFGVFALPKQVRPALLLIIALPSLLLPVFYDQHPPYREVLNTIQPRYLPDDSRIVVNNGGLDYFDLYLADFLPVDRRIIFPVRRPLLTPSNLGEEAITFLQTGASQEADRLMAFLRFLGTADHLWYLETDDADDFGQDYRAIIEQRYIPLGGVTFDSPPYSSAHRLTEYRRIPPYQYLFHFGDQFTLQSWRLREDVHVQACQQITIESWWTARRIPDTNYSLTVVLADASGMGVNRADGTPANVLTGLWQPRQAYLDERTIQIPCDAAPGEYPLLMGMYDFETNTNLPITTGTGAAVNGLAYLTTLFVEQP
jgi:hypothetical protein